MQDAFGHILALGDRVELLHNHYDNGQQFPPGIRGKILSSRIGALGGDKIFIEIPTGQRFWIKTQHVGYVKSQNQQTNRGNQSAQSALKMYDAKGQELQPGDNVILIISHHDQNTHFPKGTIGIAIRRHSQSADTIRVNFGGQRIWVGGFEIEFHSPAAPTVRQLGVPMKRPAPETVKKSDGCPQCGGPLEWFGGGDYCSQCKQPVWTMRQGVQKQKR